MKLELFQIARNAFAPKNFPPYQTGVDKIRDLIWNVSLEAYTCSTQCGRHIRNDISPCFEVYLEPPLRRRTGERETVNI